MLWHLKPAKSENGKDVLIVYFNREAIYMVGWCMRYKRALWLRFDYSRRCCRGQAGHLRVGEDQWPGLPPRRPVVHFDGSTLHFDGYTQLTNPRDVPPDTCMLATQILEHLGNAATPYEDHCNGHCGDYDA